MKIDTIKKFLIDYKRYFAAGALFVLFVLVLVMCAGPEESREPAESENSAVEVKDGNTADTQNNVPDTEKKVNLAGAVEKTGDEEMIALMQKYYKAYADNDTAALEAIVSVLSDNEKSYIATFSEYYEEYRNIECYTLRLNDEEYFVSVCYDLKFYEADTPAPGMDFFYVQRNTEGELFINSAYTTYNFNFMEQPLDANIYANIIAYEEKAEITALQKDVQARYEEAVAGDENLANLVGGTLRNAMTQWRDMVADAASTEPETEQTTEQNTQEPGDNEKPEDTQENGQEPEDGTYTVQTLDICNVRATPGTDGEMLGRVLADTELTALGTEGDWTKVEFQGGTGYIRSDLLKKV
ncbi:MAG: SH3 domain-containing protein [Blautia sp.]|nr:SH3 domain-containing protein [Blautia sp.]